MCGYKRCLKLQCMKWVYLKLACLKLRRGKEEAGGASEDPLQILERFCESLENRLLPSENPPIEMEEQQNPVNHNLEDNVSSSTNATLPRTEQGDVSSSTHAVLPDSEPSEVEMETQDFQ